MLELGTGAMVMYAAQNRETLRSLLEAIDNATCISAALAHCGGSAAAEARRWQVSRTHSCTRVK